VGCGVYGRRIPEQAPTHVRVCLSGDNAVFLDLRRDKYQAVGRDARASLRGQIVGWPDDDACVPEPPDPSALLSTLLEHGLLTIDPRIGRSAAPPAAAPPAEALIDDEFARHQATAPSDFIRFFAACTKAALSLRLTSLERIVDAISRRKQQALVRGERSTLARDRVLVSTFNRLRPFAFSACRFCLYDSLALLEFLAMYDSYPCWVIGVHTNPFAAHSWLQQHGYLFNGPIDQVARYTPILVV
jgi:hypothetical protein